MVCVNDIKTIVGKRKQQKKSKSDLINTIRGLLVSHVTEFDLKFKELMARPIGSDLSAG